MSNLNRHIKSDAIKWIAVTLAVLVLAVGVTAAMTKGFTDWNPYGWLDKKTDTPADIEDKPNEAEGLIVTPDVQNAGVRLSAARVVSNDGIDTQSNESYVITATVKDQYDLDYEGQLTYSLTWASTSSNDVTEYVAVSEAADNRSWTLTCLQAFDTKITFKVSVAADPTVSASATLGYNMRTLGLTAHFGPLSEAVDITSSMPIVSFTLPTYTSMCSIANKERVIDLADFSYSLTTSPPRGGTNVSFIGVSISSAFLSALMAQGLDYENLELVSMTSAVTTVTFSELMAKHGIDLNPGETTAVSSAERTKLAKWYKAAGDTLAAGNYLYKVSITCHTVPNYTYYLNLTTGVSSPSSLSFNSTTVNF